MQEAEKTYEINGKKYTQRKLVLGQVVDLVELLGGIEFTSLDALAVVKSVGPDLPEALAIVLVPEGVEVDKKDLPAFAREFSNHMPLETALEVVSDFLSFNPLRSLFTKFRGVLTAALDGMKEPPSGKT